MAVIARIAYALLFCATLPLLLVLWARGTSGIVTLPAYGNLPIALSLSIAGLLLFASGIAALWKRGGGLPMNAFPPPRLVSSGVYALCPHPIYVGFCLVCFGVAMAAQSGSGLWLVTPAAALGCVALVYGYEKPDLLRRFGRERLKVLRWLPQATDDRPAFPEFLRFFLYVQVPWVAIYEIIAVLGVQRGSLDTRVAFELRLPVWTWTEAIYASTYLVALLAPVLTPTKRDLRSLTIRSWLAMVTVFPVFLFVPTHAPFRPCEGGGLLGHILQFERALDMPAEALPSFHVIWAILAAAAIRSRIAILWAVAVAFSCVMNGMHSMADVIAGAVWSVGLLRADRVWERLRSSSEAIANSWTEWRLGRFRLINHAFYGGVSSFVCVAIVGALAGNLPVVAFTAAVGLLGAGIWAQCLEGSSRLLRPFGFYGGLLGVILASVAGPNPWLVLAAYSVAGPWLQSLGRLRCLVQGCCHGRPADVHIGIRYHHPRSRVCRIAGLAGLPLHPTPLYSIATNLLTALVVARLWAIGAPLPFIGGVFLMLNGLGRFVEEGYRGEPQTSVFAGLRLYQWIAIASVIAGAAITTIPGAAAPAPHFTWTGLCLAALFGVISGLALGFDAPESERRFGRLT